MKKALKKLYVKDNNLLLERYTIHERTVVHRLAIYLEEVFGQLGYDVDIEYNRMMEDYSKDAGEAVGKCINWEESGEGTSYVYPDIIIHKRHTRDNLVEIEVKMTWKNSRKTLDYEKINEYIKQLNYQFGVYIELAENESDSRIEFGPF